MRNMILAGVLTVVILLGWDSVMRYFYPSANKPQPVATASPAASSSAAPATREGGLTNPADVAAEARDLKTALANPGRVKIEAPGLSGSINLTGGVLDDLSTNRHTAALDQGQGLQRIYSPAGTPAQQFAQFGWTIGDGTPPIALPNAQTAWTAPVGAKLTPQSPVTLSWNNGAGQTFTLTYAIDADYMLTVTQGVANAGPTPVAIKPIAQLNRTDKTASASTFNIHSGPFGSYDEKVKFDIGYNCDGSFFISSCEDLSKMKTIVGKGNPNWIGFTDIYWMSTLIPEKTGASSDFRSLDGGIFLANLFYPQAAIAPGQQTARVTKLFAGAKETSVLDAYEATGIPNFSLAIDWGWFRWFEKPIFGLLKWLFAKVDNFGVAIMLLTGFWTGVSRENAAPEMMLLAILAGAAAGFLVFNVPPASIFMGDSGALLFGFSLAALTLGQEGVRASRSDVLSVIAGPAFVLLIPIFDTTLVTVARLLSGRSPAVGGRDHSSHRLVAIGLSERNAVLVLWALASIGGGIGLLLRNFSASWSMPVGAVFLLGMGLFAVYLVRVRVYDEAPAGTPPTAFTPLQSTYLNKRRVVEVIVDASLIGASYYWATLLVFQDPEAYLRNAEIFYESLPIVIATQLVAFFAMGLYRGLWRAFVSFDVEIIIKGIVIGTLVTQLFLLAYYGYFAIAWQVVVLQAAIVTTGIVASRLISRLFPPS